MSAWWIHLSFSHGLLIILAVVLPIGTLWLRRATRPRPQATPVPRRTPPVVDYSAQYQKKRDWLGDRHLLAKPINQRIAR